MIGGQAWAWDYYLQNRKATSLITALDSVFSILLSRYHITHKVMECDGEIPKSHRVCNYLEKERLIKVEPSDPQSQNGGAERLGAVIKQKARAMRSGSKLPTFFWAEIVRTVYLYNRTPIQQEETVRTLPYTTRLP